MRDAFNPETWQFTQMTSSICAAAVHSEISLTMRDIRSGELRVPQSSLIYEE